MTVKPGDVVEFRSATSRSWTLTAWGFLASALWRSYGRGRIYSIDPDESLNECLLWQQSAGHDRNGNWMSGAERLAPRVSNKGKKIGIRATGN